VIGTHGFGNEGYDLKLLFDWSSRRHNESLAYNLDILGKLMPENVSQRTGPPALLANKFESDDAQYRFQ
jgi:hypothetical protein